MINRMMLLLVVIIGMSCSSWAESCPAKKDLVQKLKDFPGNKQVLDEVLRGFACYGHTPLGEEVKQSAVKIYNGKCMMAETYDVTDPTKFKECCEPEGTCRGSSCIVPGGNTQNGTSCDCDSCVCVDCVWFTQSCFTSPNWHKNAAGAYDEINGNTCFGIVRCKPVLVSGEWVRPNECEDERVGSFCVEDNVHFENKKDEDQDGIDDGWYAATMATVSTGNYWGPGKNWNSTFKACGYNLCNDDYECCRGQKCDTSKPPRPCATCGVRNGTCIDDTPFVPESKCPCDPNYRSETCQAAVNDYVGYTQVDVPDCEYEEVDAIKAQYGCEKVSPDCDTWVCTVAPTPLELEIIQRKLSSCIPVLVPPPAPKPDIPEP